MRKPITLTEQEKQRQKELAEMWASALNDERLAHDLRHLAEDVRFHSVENRAAVLNEAAKRLDAARARETLQHVLEIEADRQRALREQQDDEQDDEFSMGELVEHVRRLGMDAFVEHTGGGCMTIFVRPMLDEGTGDERYAACAGPGYIVGSASFASRSEFYIGPDDCGESGESVAVTNESVEQMAEMLVAVARRTSESAR